MVDGAASAPADHAAPGPGGRVDSDPAAIQGNGGQGTPTGQAATATGRRLGTRGRLENLESSLRGLLARARHNIRRGLNRVHSGHTWSEALPTVIWLTVTAAGRRDLLAILNDLNLDFRGHYALCNM